MSLRSFMSIVFLWGLLTSFTSVATAGEASSIASKSLTVDGQTRTYQVHAPQLGAKEKIPLLVVLHGGMGNGSHASQSMGFNDLADQNHFFVVYPDGTSLRLGKDHRVWNAGKCCGIAARKDINDVKFLEQMVKELIQQYPIDSKRVYLTGMSNGAMMTERLICESSDIFAAAVAVSGTLMVGQCKKGQSVPLLHIHGSADKNVPFNGGHGQGLSHADFRAVPETIQMITASRSCAPPVTKENVNGDTDISYKCQKGAPVQLHLIKGGVHAWPKDGSVQVWNFVRDYSK